MAKEDITAFILVKVMPVSHKASAYQSLSDLNGILEMYEVIGEFDVLIKVNVENMKQLRTLIDKISSIEGVYRAESIVSTFRAK